MNEKVTNLLEHPHVYPCLKTITIRACNKKYYIRVTCKYIFK